MTPTTTLALIFCDKPHCVAPQIEALEEMRLPKKEMKLLIVDVSGNNEVTYPLKLWFKKFGKKFAKAQYVEQAQSNQVPTEVPKAENPEVFLRKRWAVAETKNLMNKYREGDLFLIEEDTLCPPYTYFKLRHILDLGDKVGAATGINYSRNSNMGMGMNTCWKFQSNRVYPYGEVSGDTEMRIVRVPEKEFGIEPVGASGNGCMLVRGDLMENYRFMGRSIELGSDGSDVNFGMYITQQKEKLFMVDWSIKTKHLRCIDGELEAITSVSFGNEYDWKNS